MDAWTSVPTLVGGQVFLEPLATAHAAALGEASRDGELWKLRVTSVPSPASADAYVAAALAMQAAGTALPFVVRGADGDIVGSTRFCHLDPVNRRAEIGYTWYARRVQRTALNTQAKRLLLAHAFEAMGCVAVELRTHRLNHASRRAIERLGAQQDGILRNHMRMPDGTLRDTVVYSILDSEWPAVRSHIDHLLEPSA